MGGESSGAAAPAAADASVASSSDARRAAPGDGAGRVRVATAGELETDGVRVVTADEASVAVFWHDGRPYALDNRCPHMGFPLHRGTVEAGTVTCHWHHARFDLAGGCTFNAFADDARAYPAWVDDDGVVWVATRPVDRDERAHHLRKLSEGLSHRLELVLAKAVLGLDGRAPLTEVLACAARFGVAHRAEGWSDGLSILVALANLRPHLSADDRRLALFHGLAHVARATAGHAPSFDLDPLDTEVADADRFAAWFRRFCEVRADGAAERTLRAAVGKLSPHEVVALLGAAGTDHRYLDVGHTLDFANKAVELLDHVGWEAADDVLPSLIPAITGGRRMEETGAWRHPVDLAGLVVDTAAGLTLPSESVAGWDEHAAVAELVVDGDPETMLAELARLVRAGVPVAELSAAVAYAAGLRLAHFPTINDPADWNTVHHAFTYAGAVDQLLRRAPATPLLRGLLDAAAAVHLERFLNVPKRPLPQPTRADREPRELLACFDQHGGVDEAGQATADLLAAERADEVIATLGHGLVREDAGFHSYQVLEAAVRQYHQLPAPLGGHVLVGAARFLAAHSPTMRSRGRTWEVACRLHRGETVHDVDPAPEL